MKEVTVLHTLSCEPHSLIGKVVEVDVEVVVWLQTPVECTEHNIQKLLVKVESILDSETAPFWHRCNYEDKLLFGIRGKLSREHKEKIVSFWLIKAES